MDMSKYRYNIYPDRTYVFKLDGAIIEMTGYELYELLGIESYIEA